LRRRKRKWERTRTRTRRVDGCFVGRGKEPGRRKCPCSVGADAA
jgi:hypothetical protein